MKAQLMHRGRDFSLPQELPPNDRVLIEDLGLESVFAAMGGEDAFLVEVSRQALMAGLADPAAIEYRQAALRDCLAHPEVARELYEIAVEATQAPKKIWGSLGRSPGLVLSHSVRVMELLLVDLRRLRTLADEDAAAFDSEAFSRFFAMIGEELDDAYLDTVAEHLKRLAVNRGVLISAKLGDGNKGSGYVLRRAANEPRGLARIAGLFENSGYSFRLAPRDEAGARTLGQLRDQGLNLVAEAAAQSADHIVSFFAALLAEVGFYVACLNLHEELKRRGEPTCMPVPVAATVTLEARELYDVGLALRSEEKLIANELSAEGRSLVVITGANQGGKSTFLRGIGLAQLMMQCGMFVGAERFQADVRDGLFTHFKREEDASMRSGKLDEELARMAEIVDALKPGSLVLFNESFAATNEQEGSEIARQISRALLDAGIKVFHVTHMYELAHGFEHSNSGKPLFLRAEREEDGARTFRLLEGEPLSTSFGEDVYRRVFSTNPAQPGLLAKDVTEAIPRVR